MSASKSSAEVFEAYLNLQTLVSGGFASPAWTADGADALRTDETATGSTAAGGVDSFSNALGWKSDGRPEPRTWKRYDYLSATLEVPEQLSPSGEWFASVQDHNLVLRAVGALGEREQRLTTDGDAQCLWDIEAPRFRVASGRRVTFGGISPWSPDSLTLLAYRRDLRGVFRIPRLNWLAPFEDVEYLPCQKAGAGLDRVQPVFVDVRSGRQMPVRLPEIEDRYIQMLAWCPDSGQALIAVYTRDFRRVDIFTARRCDGMVSRVLSESAPTFVKVQHDVMFGGEHGFRLLPDGSGFLWLSTRNGWNHIYHYDIAGTSIRQLTSGAWPVDQLAHMGSDGFVYFTAAVDTSRPYDLHVCRVRIEGGPYEQLTREKGTHSAHFSPAGNVFLDTHSTVDRPTRTDLMKVDGTPVRTVSKMDISRLEAVGYVPPEEFTVKAADGVTDLWGVIYKPFDFDASRTYPVLEYIYGGPQTVEAPRFFAIDPTMMSTMRLPWAMAQLGYIVMCLDARGTPGRSKAFHDAIFQNWSVGIADHAGAIRQLCDRHTWMDRDRVGIWGHSWGGYFSTCALLEAPETYHAAVSYAPGYDPWDANIYEPYLGLPTDGRKAYDDANLFKRAGTLRRPLLIAAGTSDYVVISSAMKMTRALIDAGVDHELVVIPQAFHQFVAAEERYFLLKLTGWFERHIKQRDSRSG